MSTGLIVLLAVALLIVLLMVETHVAFALAASGGIGILLLRGPDLTVATLGNVPYDVTSNYSLVIIPLYVLLGMFALHGKLAERVYATAGRLLRFLPGGLGIATVAACTGFSAVSGSSVATAASLGKLSVEEMTKSGYRPHFATGIVAIAGTLGILIPPSVALVMYGVLARESIAELLVAGIIPGLLSAAAYAVYVGMRARALIDEPTKTLASALARAGGGSSEPVEASLRAGTTDTGTTDTRQPTAFQQTRALLWIGGIAAVIVVGLFTGLFTVIESAAIGALVALVMLLVENTRLGLLRIARTAKGAFLEAAGISSMVFALVVGAGVFSAFLVMARVPMNFANWVAAVDVPPSIIVVLILLAILPLGMFLDPLAIIVIVVPLVHPAVTTLGFDGVWFAVLFVMLLEIGLVTPPVGINTFVVSMTAGVKIETVFRGVLPFVVVSLMMVAVVFLFPQLSLWLPSVVVQ